MRAHILILGRTSLPPFQSYDHDWNDIRRNVWDLYDIYNVPFHVDVLCLFSLSLSFIKHDDDVCISELCSFMTIYLVYVVCCSYVELSKTNAKALCLTSPLCPRSHSRLVIAPFHMAWSRLDVVDIGRQTSKDQRINNEMY